MKTTRIRRTIRRMLVVLPLLAGCGWVGTSDAEYRVLDDGSSLQDDFNRHEGEVRALFLASPTCGVCLRGVRRLHEELLEDHPDREITVFLVWSTQLGAEEHHVSGGAGLMSDPRVIHYWDPSDRIGRLYAPVLGTGGPAWDVWLLFDRDATWGDEPPEPAWWEHQLQGLPEELHLDAERFAEKAAELLEGEP